MKHRLEGKTSKCEGKEKEKAEGEEVNPLKWNLCQRRMIYLRR